MKKFVQIASSVTIEVTANLQCIDATNAFSPKADRLNVKPAWSKMSVLVTSGPGAWYPAEIATWDSVKSLAKSGVFTIGIESDTCPNQEKVEEMCKKLENARKDFERNSKLNRDIVKNDESIAIAKAAQAMNQQ